MLFLKAMRAFILPGILAGLIVWLGAFWRPPQESVSAAKAYFSTLFFIMYFYSQYKRVQKEVSDKDGFLQVNGRLDELIGRLPLAPAIRSGATVDFAPQPPVTRIQLARRLAERGDAFGAIIEATVALEVALEHRATHGGRRIDLGRPVSGDSFDSLPHDLQQQLRLLASIWNELKHLTAEQVSQRRDLDVVLRAYESAVDQLGALAR